MISHVTKVGVQFGFMSWRVSVAPRGRVTVVTWAHHVTLVMMFNHMTSHSHCNTTPSWIGLTVTKSECSDVVLWWGPVREVRNLNMFWSSGPLLFPEKEEEDVELPWELAGDPIVLLVLLSCLLPKQPLFSLFPVTWRLFSRFPEHLVAGADWVRLADFLVLIPPPLGSELSTLA